MRRLETGAVYSDGGIPTGTPDCISGGVFVVHGAYADVVRNRGPVTTYGANDMVLDNWGVVDRWLAEEKITSHGPSAIGFVNFGTINVLQINAPIETFGQGARGFNVYTGTVSSAEFERIVTHADGAVGIQISQPIGSIKVRRGVETCGGTGDSLVKGVVVKLSAIALSVKPGGSARTIDIAGGLITHGEGVNPLELHVLKRIMPWCGTSLGVESLVKTFVDVGRFWHVDSFSIETIFAQYDNVAVFGRFTYTSTLLTQQVTSPFAIFAKVSDGRCSYMQFMEDTFATAASFRSGGAWRFRSDPSGEEFII